ncbi:beta-ketoacyl synthase N-terminal-like domain-containing protein [Streptomyces sp. NPDC090442]|uniref:beta-ketoacyl synthase N-terminal-like domain-containing protein n=1 Tax=Streptomyces sp. NPDC090442 TaxID=3365962 RepID=UPI0038165DB0
MTDRAHPALEPEPVLPGLARDQHVAVVGMGLVVPGADTPERFWTLLQSNDSALAAPSRFRSRPLSTSHERGEHSAGTRAGFVRAFAPHPVLAAALAAGDLDDVPDETLWLRHSALHALAGVTVRPDDRVSHVFGAWSHSTQAMEDTLVVEEIAERVAAECADDPFERIAVYHRQRRRLGGHFRHARQRPADSLPHAVLARALEGLVPDPRQVSLVDAASASSLYALHLAWEQLLSGEADFALVGGFNNVGRLGMTQLTAFGGCPPPDVCGPTTRRPTARCSPRAPRCSPSSRWAVRLPTATPSTPSSAPSPPPETAGEPTSPSPTREVRPEPSATP